MGCNKTLTTIVLSTFALGIFTVLPVFAANVVIPVGSGVNSDPNGITINPSTNEIYVADYNDGTVSVIDGNPSSSTYNHVIGSPIPVGSGSSSGPISLVINPSTNEIYVADYNDGTVSVIFDTITSPSPSLTPSVTSVTPGTQQDNEQYADHHSNHHSNHHSYPQSIHYFNHHSADHHSWQ